MEFSSCRVAFNLQILEVESVWIFHRGYLRTVSYEGFGSKRLFLQYPPHSTWDPQHLLAAGEYLLYQ